MAVREGIHPVLKNSAELMGNGMPFVVHFRGKPAGIAHNKHGMLP